MNKYERRLVGAFIGVLMLGACGSSHPDPTSKDYNELTARSLASPNHNCFLEWDDDDGEYDVECYPKGTDLPDGAFTGPGQKVKPVKPVTPKQVKPAAPKPAAPRPAPAPARPAPRTR